MGEPHEDDEVAYGLVMPFVVCDDHGGPYNAFAFVAGYTAGALDLELKHCPDAIERAMPTPLLPQIDLIAMHHGRTMKSEPWWERPDEWVWVEISAAVTS